MCISWKFWTVDWCYTVVNIADKKLFDNIANILIYVYVWVLLTLQMLLLISRLWVQRRATEVEQRRIWFKCHLCLSPLVSFHTYCTCSTHPSCLPLYLRGNMLPFMHETKTDFPPVTHTGNISERTAASPVYNPANAAAQSRHIKAAGWNASAACWTSRSRYKSENLLSVYVCVIQQSSYIHSILNGAPRALRLCLTSIFAAMHN